MWGENIFLDFILRIGLVKDELAQVKSQLARADGGPHLKAELARLRKELQQTVSSWESSTISAIGPSRRSRG